MFKLLITIKNRPLTHDPKHGSYQPEYQQKIGEKEKRQTK